MNPEKSIFWHQGLFLQPQHFQQTDLYHRSLLTPLHKYRQPFPWGICNVEINEAALLDRVVEFTKFEAVFQDYSWVVSGKNCTLSSRSFAEEDNAFLDGDSFIVYIGLKKNDPLFTNVSRVDSRDEQVHTRYISLEDPEEFQDQYEKGPPAQVHFLEHNCRIFWQSEQESTGDYHLIPVLRLQMNGEFIQVDSSFVPPPLTLDSSNVVMQVVKNIREQMLARCRVLESYKPINGQDVGGLEVRSLYYLFTLNTLNKYVAQLQHILAHPVIHPWQLYGVLVELVAELSTFSQRINCLAQLRDGRQLISDYDHLNADRCFQEIQQLISELLEGVVIGSENILILQRENDRFSCEIDREILKERQLYCLMVRTTHEQAEVINALTHLVKTGSSTAIDTLVGRSLSGIDMVYREIPPLGIAKRQGCFCFELHTDSSRWQEVTEDGILSLHWNQAPEDVTIELVITRL